MSDNAGARRSSYMDDSVDEDDDGNRRPRRRRRAQVWYAVQFLACTAFRPGLISIGNWRSDLVLIGLCVPAKCRWSNWKLGTLIMCDTLTPALLHVAGQQVACHR